VEEGDRLDFITWGGGGWGDPLTRDPDLVALEVRRGLVTRQGARDYGVVVDEAGQADGPATLELRAKMQATRPDLPLFNRGPSIDELRADCLARTGLPAPKPPVWRRAPTAMAAE
jgi:N-methylhydantoinase B